MRKVFSSWRRKAGCGVLVVALLLTGGWFRSALITDNVSIRIGRRLCSLESLRGCVIWASVDYSSKNEVPNPIRWKTYKASDFPASIPAEELIANENEFEAHARHRYWLVRYWRLVLPLTLLSAGLLLWPARKTLDQNARAP